jgi:hypothetical protein
VLLVLGARAYARGLPLVRDPQPGRCCAMNGMRDDVYRRGSAMRGSQATTGFAALRPIFALGRMATGERVS